jgi:lysozyme family protein
MADHKILVPFILRWEGGLSRATTDTASRNPSPCNIKGLTGWHTNKGITWSTFTSLAPKLGYQATCENFEKMPDEIWSLIFKRGYWDAVGGDQLKSQAIANVAGNFAYGAGPFRAVQRLQMAVNNISTNKIPVDGKIGPKTISAVNAANEKALFEEYTKLTRAFYTSLPGQEANQRGWENRHKALFEFSKKYIVPIGGGLLAIALIFFLIIQKKRNSF